MSYARRWPGHSDVYVFARCWGLFDCSGCSLCDDTFVTPVDGWEMRGDFVTSVEELMIAHLIKHVQAGHLVPRSVFERFAAEAWLEIEFAPMVVTLRRPEAT